MNHGRNRMHGRAVLFSEYPGRRSVMMVTGARRHSFEVVAALQRGVARQARLTRTTSAFPPLNETFVPLASRVCEPRASNRRANSSMLLSDNSQVTHYSLSRQCRQHCAQKLAISA